MATTDLKLDESGSLPRPEPVGRFVRLALAIWAWELYVFSHLGLAFFVSSVIGTPGGLFRSQGLHFCEPFICTLQPATSVKQVSFDTVETKQK